MGIIFVIAMLVIACLSGVALLDPALAPLAEWFAWFFGLFTLVVFGKLLWYRLIGEAFGAGFRRRRR